MSWPGEKQRHSMSSRGVRTAEECYNMGTYGTDTKSDMALTAVMTGNDQRPYGIGIAVRNERGYSPFYKGDLWFKTYHEAQDYAKDYNEKMGLTERESMEIVLTTMRASGVVEKKPVRWDTVQKLLKYKIAQKEIEYMKTARADLPGTQYNEVLGDAVGEDGDEYVFNHLVDNLYKDSSWEELIELAELHNIKHDKEFIDEIGLEGATWDDIESRRDS